MSAWIRVIRVFLCSFSAQLFKIVDGMPIVAASPPDLLPPPAWRMICRRHFTGKFASPHMGMRALIRASSDWKKECSVDSKDVRPDFIRLGISSGPSDLRFDRLQPSEEEINCRHRRGFGRFIAREAILEEEYWTAAWLRAESHWKINRGQEFNAIKRRCKRKYADDCTCIITAKKEEKGVKRTVLSSIVGTLDISIRQLLCGQTFPGESSKAPVSCGIFRSDLPRYGYISNLCVAKYARRQGIASNMLLLAVDAVRSSGVSQIFINVQKDNTTAQKLYETIGFQVHTFSQFTVKFAVG
ncbi:hypothetical protein KSP40_PGU019889 [Platanthera guangdongensis]|uniref:N-acetyltransferase domain-containing protein n=1 Tax=Platanthera guangdongensis TaxID=2320717 RepID=A0ABR2LI79_9ASPA